MDDPACSCAGLALTTVIAVVGVLVLALILTWEPRGSSKLTYCPYCVAVARTKPPPAHCWRCGGRYDKAPYSLDWDAMNLELFRSYHGRNPDGFMGDPNRPPTPGRRPDADGYRKEHHE